MIHLPASVRVYLCLSPCDSERVDGLFVDISKVHQPEKFSLSVRMRVPGDM
jgi:hypothetical protein